jgi:hypothetical protein
MKILNVLKQKSACKSPKIGGGFSTMLVFALLLLSFYATANQPFYFIAKQAPESSLTMQGMSNQVVYLRWDILEGNIPNDITQFNLYRDGALIGQYPAQSILTAQQVTRLYQSSAQNRRLLETLTLLKEESVLDPNLTEVNPNNYGSEIIARIERDNYWAQLASKRDFNIAIARNRGAIDRPGVGVFEYELRAVNLASQMRRIGLVSVDTNQSQSLLAIPSFEQLALSQCDEPDIKDHYSVALNWAVAGELNMADRVANQLFIGGYDVYRSLENIELAVTTAPNRDLAAEAASLGFNNKGQVNFADLERINDTLITVSADFDPNSPEWLETHADLAAAGLKPGDRRAYYLVARDFTGNFGPSIGTIVTVGDMSRPPMPWDIEIYLSQENQQVELSFEKIDKDSYLESFGGTKRVCDISEDGAISFVGRDESCAEQRHKIIQTQVNDYVLYRFDNFADASRFKDSDGDGFSDRIERPSNTQCQAAAQAGGNMVMSSFVIQEFDNHTRVIVADEAPALEKGNIFWYRLAAKSIAGRLSFLSEPLRVNFPDRDLPEAPSVSITYAGDGDENCGCELDYEASDEPWSFSIDGRLGASINFSCNGNNYSVTQKDINDGGASACRANFMQGNLASDCALGGQISAPSSSFSCSDNIPAGTDFCGTGSMSLKPVSCDSVPAPAGMLVGPVSYTAEAKEPDQCVSIYQEVAGVSVRVSSSCGDDSQSDTYVVEKGEFCGYAVSHDVNNNISVATRFDCRQVIDASEPNNLLAPRINVLELGEDFASATIALPTQQQSILELELVRKLPTQSELSVVRQGIASSAANEVIVNLDLPPLTDASDQWCVRSRIHGGNENVGTPNLSSWSKQRCETRASSLATVPKWLSWPGLKRANQAEALVVTRNRDFGFLPFNSPISQGLHIPIMTAESSCRLSPNSVTLFGDVTQTPIGQGAALINLDCGPTDRTSLIGLYSPLFNFIVFRQHRVEGKISDFKQVSPLIDYAHWLQTVDAKNSQRFVLKDPYIWASSSDMNTQAEISLNYVDRSPLLLGREYRYQLVYFNAKHELISWRETPWIELSIDGGSAAQQLVQGVR